MLSADFEKGQTEEEIFPDGKYMTLTASADRVFDGWKSMEKWRKDTKTEAGNHRWLEECIFDEKSKSINKIKILYPVK